MRLTSLESENSSIWQPMVVVAVVVFGGIAVALVTGAILMATRLGWDLRLLSLVGAPLGFACYWFLIRKPSATDTWRESLPALSIAIALISSALNLVFGVSPVYAVFTLSAAAGLCGMTYIRFLGALRLMKVVMAVVETVKHDESEE